VTPRADILAAASLLLAIVAAFFSLWYPEIRAALGLKVSDQFDDRGPERKQTREALRRRALPLAVASVLLAAVFLPEGLHIVIHWFRVAVDRGLWHAITAYDPVSLSLVVVAGGLTAIALNCAALSVELAKKRRTIDTRPAAIARSA
jgi:hypothetical protein